MSASWYNGFTPEEYCEMVGERAAKRRRELAEQRRECIVSQGDSWTRVTGLTAPMNNFVKEGDDLLISSRKPDWKREMQSEIDSWLSSVKI